jgi:hypothetical protein
MYQNENYRQMLYLSHLIWLAYYEAEQPPAARDYFREWAGTAYKINTRRHDRPVGGLTRFREDIRFLFSVRGDTIRVGQ